MSSSAVATTELEHELVWLREFEKDHGRSLRVLHVGNIAANGYLNSKFLRRVGVEADLMVCDYYHVMAYPEWEDVDLKHGHGDDFAPTFHEDDMRDYERPDWVFHGNIDECIDQAGVVVNSDRRPIRKNWSWARELPGVDRAIRLIGAIAGRIFPTRFLHSARLLISEPKIIVFHCLEWLADCGLTAIRRFRHVVPRQIRSRISTKRKRKIVLSLVRLAIYSEGRKWTASDQRSTLFARSINAAKIFSTSFPNRKDLLTPTESIPWVARAEHLKNLFDHYDIVQCYAVEPISALLSGKRPYVCFEHGTLRDFTQGDLPLHRLTALAYQQADHAFITNGDCLAYAKKIGMFNYSPIIHPIDVEQHRQDFSREAAQIRADENADVLIFCPVRHDYKVKGTDVAIKALPVIKERLPGKHVVMVLADWGAQVDESRAMLKAFGCEDNVSWCQAMCRVAMIKMIQASDCVLDQFVLPVFGSTAPQSIAAGTPVVASYDPAQTAWLIPEPAPIITARTPLEVADAVVRTQDANWLAGWQARARSWIDTYHHPNNTIADHLAVYQSVLEKHNRLASTGIG